LSVEYAYGQILNYKGRIIGTCESISEFLLYENDWKCCKTFHVKYYLLFIRKYAYNFLKIVIMSIIVYN